MANKESEIHKICSCLTVLTSEINIVGSSDDFRGCNNIREAVFAKLKKNIHLTFLKIEIYPNIKTYVAKDIELCSCENCEACDQFVFLKLCLILLRLLKRALLGEVDAAPIQEMADAIKPRGILSITQQNTVKKCLQFVVALGILPNLPPGIGVPLYKRTKHAMIIEHFVSDNSVYKKHIQIAETLETLIQCLGCTAMQSSILTYHGTDMLAALLLMCHTSIDNIENDVEVVLASGETTSKENLSPSVQMTNLMLQNRKHFSPHLETFLKQISPSLLIWDLLLFQGIPMQNEKKEISKTDVPVWMNKICNQMLTNMILERYGIVHLVEVVLDKVFGVDIQSEKVDVVRMEAVARIIAYLPVHHISVACYFQRLSEQVFANLHLETSSPMNNVLKYVASCIVLQLCKRNIKLAREHLLDRLLKPLKHCVQEPANPQSKILVKESELTTCIEDLHQIFIIASSPLSRTCTKLLFPFSHCLCDIFFFLMEGKSALKSKVKSLICSILSSSSNDKSLSLLDTVCFTNNKSCGIHITKVSFENGEEGGIIAVPKIEEDFHLEKIRHHAISDILSELQNKDLIRSYILLVLKEFSSFYLESGDKVIDLENKKLGCLFSAIQIIPEWNVNIEEALMSNLSEVIDVLMTLLENMSNCKSNTSFYEETLFVVMMILNSILNSYDQLTPSDWTALKKFLPSLQKLQKSDISSHLKQILFTNTSHIATHGATCKNDIEINSPNFSNSVAESTKSFPEQSSHKQSLKSKLSTTNINKFADKNTLNVKQEMKVLRESSKKELDVAISSAFEDLSLQNVPESQYEEAIRDAKNPLVYIRGHGLIALGKLLQEKDVMTLKNKKELLNIFLENLEDDDSYVFLPAINGLCILADIDSEAVLPVLLNLYKTSKEKCIILKLGEALPKICISLGDLIFKYKEILLSTFLYGTKNEDPDIQSSNLSNLGQTCMCLKFKINDHWLQEVLECTLSFLKPSHMLEIRRSAVMVLYQLLQGVGRYIIEVLKNEIKEVYVQLKIIYSTESDEVLRLHSQLALEEIDIIMKDLLSTKAPLTKEIRILQ